jgi:multicomponent Na+:H+ antiporter subunit B
MNSLILRTTAQLLISLLLIFSLVLLLRGHDNPGGGFAGGLVATTAWALYSLAFGAEATRKVVKYDPRSLAGVGLLLALVAGVIPVLLSRPFLTGLWIEKVGTPLLFDVGVYLVIQGTALNIILSLEEEE